MTVKPTPPGDELRTRAQRRIDTSCRGTRELTALETVALIEELQVHQVELLIQNEELREAESELRCSRDRIEKLYDSAPVGYVTLNPAGVVLEANALATELLGVERSNLIGRRLAEFVMDADKNDVWRHVRHTLSHSGHHSCEVALLTQDAAVHVRLESVADTELESPQEVCRTALVDITERVLEAESRRHLERKLRQTQKLEAVGQLASGMAHDLNNYLTALIGCASMAEGLIPATSRAKGLLGQILSIADDMALLSRDLVSFSASAPQERQLLDLNVVVAESLHLIEHSFAANVSVNTQLAETPLWIEGDATQLRRVLINLALNAREAMPAGGTLAVTTASESPAGSRGGSDGEELPRLHPSHALLIVADTGTGMEESVLEHIFEPFFTTASRAHGTGLGLAVVHGIIQGHSGRVDVRSAPHEGTTFTVALPICPAPRQATPVSTVQTAPRGNQELVLVVEDAPDVRQLLVEYLRSLNYAVMVAADGEAMLQCFWEYRERIALLVVDVDLPKLSGLQGVLAIRAGGAETPVVLITGRCTRDLEPHLTERWVLLPKPFQPSQLGALVGKLMASCPVTQTSMHQQNGPGSPLQ